MIFVHRTQLTKSIIFCYDDITSSNNIYFSKINKKINKFGIYVYDLIY